MLQVFSSFDGPTQFLPPYRGLKNGKQCQWCLPIDNDWKDVSRIYIYTCENDLYIHWIVTPSFPHAKSNTAFLWTFLPFSPLAPFPINRRWLGEWRVWRNTLPTHTPLQLIIMFTIYIVQISMCIWSNALYNIGNLCYDISTQYLN